MSSTVFVRDTMTVRWATKGGVSSVRLIKGETWSTDDPFVKDRPELFADEPTVLRGTRGSAADQPARTPALERDVEAGTRAPGERRGGRSRG